MKPRSALALAVLVAMLASGAVPLFACPMPAGSLTLCAKPQEPNLNRCDEMHAEAPVAIAAAADLSCCTASVPAPDATAAAKETLLHKAQAPSFEVTAPVADGPREEFAGTAESAPAVFHERQARLCIFLI